MKNHSIITIVLTGVFFLVILLIGYAAQKKTHGMSEFMIGGQKLGVWVTSFGIMAAVMSGWTWLGNPGTCYSVGYAGSVRFLAFSPLGLVISYFILAKPVRIISSRAKCYTLPDILAARWNGNKTIRLLSTVIIIIGSMTYLLSQWTAMGTVMQYVLGVSYRTGVLIGALIISSYVIGGGMLASMWTNFLQMIIMFIVAIFFLVRCLDSVGGFVAMNTAVAAINPQYVQPWWEEASFGVTQVLSYSVLVVTFAYGGQPAVNTKFLMIRDSKQLKWSALISVVALIVGTTTFIAGIAGIVLVNNGTIPAPEKPDMILLSVISHCFPPVIAGFVLVATLAAVMSTAETYLFSSATSLTQDLLIHFFGVKLEEKRLLKITRRCMILVSFVTVLLALRPPAMISIIGGQAFGVFCAGFAPVLYLGLRWKRINSKGAIAGMSVGLLIGGILPILEGTLVKDSIMPGWTIAGVAVVLAYGVTIMVSIMTKPEKSSIFNKNII